MVTQGNRSNQVIWGTTWQKQITSTWRSAEPGSCFLYKRYRKSHKAENWLLLLCHLMFLVSPPSKTLHISVSKEEEGDSGLWVLLFRWCWKGRWLFCMRQNTIWSWELILSYRCCQTLRIELITGVTAAWKWASVSFSPASGKHCRIGFSLFF